ncbi:IS66 family transposase [Caballeronia sp. J97]|uniref:IS66 family transposase n=1 Tax=Caballeronia sp. J97 TaxID=2805429 RepID=UPI002AB13410|nr:transposase [Caballeronia sp. J97]
MLANILVNTYVDHLPLNRQEMRSARRGIHLPRATLCEWKLAAADLVGVLMPSLRSHQLQAPGMHVDDTILPLLEKGRKIIRTARLWGYLGTGQLEGNGVWVDHPPAVVFKFAESRAGDIIAVACWAHCARRFFETAKTQSNPGLAAQALQWIAQLYAIEPRINHWMPDVKYAVRQTEALPVLAKVRQWLEGNIICLPAQAPLANVFGYALRHWQALVRYTESGVLLPDKNALDRQIRRNAPGRPNWTFAGSPRGARATATMYPLLGTARVNGLEPYAWLKVTLEKLPSHPVNRVHELLPLVR